MKLENERKSERESGWPDATEACVEEKLRSLSLYCFAHLQRNVVQFSNIQMKHHTEKYNIYFC